MYNTVSLFNFRVEESARQSSDSVEACERTVKDGMNCRTNLNRDLQDAFLNQFNNNYILTFVFRSVSTTVLQEM